ncbi:alpha/beta-hydrolase [Aulographum hederae CBS 113979]|uniref:Carboxypeptidase n=1 Tax=Aulographum hederae CBS 113979 TaxID=1176131 RepID=A0A6G1HFD5_9PEZI|nr:alpha/beta-hydrolase [Aulographum hederae CBS 113979]
MHFQLLTIVALSAVSLAQYPPVPKYSSIIKSPIDPAITISYKSPDPGTCTTVFDTQKQYTGYVNLPPFSLAPIQQNYSINTFFWFVEARENPETSPLMIWINGGPGSSSMIGFFAENGPCEVVQMADGKYGTQARMWGWDRSANVLFIDQPAQVGFSYDELHNATHDGFRDEFISPEDYNSSKSEFNYGLYYTNGTFPSFDMTQTANTSQIAAQASWHFLQGFLSAFPQYNPGVRADGNETNPAGVNLFAESYGGMYGPAFANFFQEQNEKRSNGTLSPNKTLDIELDSLGIVNGMVDVLVQTPYFPKFTYNNTHSIQVSSLEDSLNLLYDFTTPGGCGDLIRRCRQLANVYDPDDEGDVDSVNQICSIAAFCGRNIMASFSWVSSNRSVYDIRQMEPDPVPNPAFLEYLNTAQVQASIGAPLNFTESNRPILNSFLDTGDEVRTDSLEDLASLIRRGVRVALIYGDADYICNWMGGEAVSLALAATLPQPYSQAFPAAGYADIVVNSSYVGGVVRQWGNLSFSRIYDAGHMVPLYQPETAFTVFTRIVQGTDVGTGNNISVSLAPNADKPVFGTTGPLKSYYMNKKSQSQKAQCFVRSISSTCTDEQQEMMMRGEGVVKAGIWYVKEDEYEPPSSTVMGGVPGTPIPTISGGVVAGVDDGAGGGSGDASGSTVVTGVYVATGTPKPNNGQCRSKVVKWGLLAAVSVELVLVLAL